MIKLQETLSTEIEYEMRSFCKLNGFKDENLPIIVENIKRQKGNIYFDTFKKILQWWTDGYSEINTRGLTARFIGRLIQEYFRNYQSDREEIKDKDHDIDYDADGQGRTPDERERLFKETEPERYEAIMAKGLERVRRLYNETFIEEKQTLKSIHELWSLYNYIKEDCKFTDQEVENRSEQLKKWNDEIFVAPTDTWGRAIKGYVRDIPSNEVFRRAAIVSLYFDTL